MSSVLVNDPELVDEEFYEETEKLLGKEIVQQLKAECGEDE